MQIKPYKIPHPFRKLTKELIDTIVQDIAEGSTHKLASLANGITPRIFDIWRAQGRVDVEHDQDSMCAYLVLSLSKIKQTEVKKCRKIISKSSKGHKGAEWTLEHAYWRDFSSNGDVKQLAKEIEDLRDQAQGEMSHGKEMDQGSDQTQGSAS